MALGATVDALEVDLSTVDGVDRLYAAARGRAVDALLANAGHGLGHGFLDQDFGDVRHAALEVRAKGDRHAEEGRNAEEKGESLSVWSG